MKVKLLSCYAGPAGNFGAGDVVEFAQHEAEALIAGQYAVAAEEAPPVVVASRYEEAVDLSPVERAVDDPPHAKAPTKGKGKK